MYENYKRYVLRLNQVIEMQSSKGDFAPILRSPLNEAEFERVWSSTTGQIAMAGFNRFEPSEFNENQQLSNWAKAA